MKILKKALLLLLSLLLLVGGVSCGSDEIDSSSATKLSFKAALSYDYLKSIDTQQVTISGYMATASPVDGSYIYLMNMPYQSCPFCKPNTSELSNTLAVYPKSGDSFDYTEQAITITGTLQVAEEGKLFSDDYGYEFSFKIVDAEYKIMSSEDMSESTKLWQAFANADMPQTLSDMYDYVYFTCAWPEFYCNSYTDSQGNTVPGYYLYAADAINFLTKEEAQYHYGYVDGYFDGIIKQLKKLDATGFTSLIANVEKAKALAEKAVADLESGKYTYKTQYVEKFGTTDDIYTLNNGEALVEEFDNLYNEYSLWLASCEM